MPRGMVIAPVRTIMWEEKSELADTARGAGGFGAVSGMYFDSTLKPMAITMFAASLLANVLAFTTGARFRKEPAALN